MEFAAWKLHGSRHLHWNFRVRRPGRWKQHAGYRPWCTSGHCQNCQIHLRHTRTSVLPFQSGATVHVGAYETTGICWWSGRILLTDRPVRLASSGEAGATVLRFGHERFLWMLSIAFKKCRDPNRYLHRVRRVSSAARQARSAARHAMLTRLFAKCRDRSRDRSREYFDTRTL
jgi:hypothetical protein